MKFINRLVFSGLILTGFSFFGLLLFDINFTATDGLVSKLVSYIFIGSLVIGYHLAVYSLISCAWVGLLYAVQLKRGFFRTLYPLNALLVVGGYFIWCLAFWLKSRLFH